MPSVHSIFLPGRKRAPIERVPVRIPFHVCRTLTDRMKLPRPPAFGGRRRSGQYAAHSRLVTLETRSSEVVAEGDSPGPKPSSIQAQPSPGTRGIPSRDNESLRLNDGVNQPLTVLLGIILLLKSPPDVKLTAALRRPLADESPHGSAVGNDLHRFPGSQRRAQFLKRLRELGNACPLSHCLKGNELSEIRQRLQRRCISLWSAVWPRVP